MMASFLNLESKRFKLKFAVSGLDSNYLDNKMNVWQKLSEKNNDLTIFDPKINIKHSNCQVTLDLCVRKTSNISCHGIYVNSITTVNAIGLEEEETNITLMKRPNHNPLPYNYEESNLMTMIEVHHIIYCKKKYSISYI